MDTRRSFLQKTALAAAGAGAAGLFPESIRRALAIEPTPGSGFLDAEHVVILMQENRSFDHAYGTLRGVRGFGDPRAVSLPNGNPVWLQSNAAGETYAPFRLNLRDTRATWMSSLPHTWTDQTDARNHGRHDGWLAAKRSKTAEFADLPLTMGYYNREDLPFYYALADAFTVCDQNFCSSLTGTTPNRLHLWTGTVRAEASPSSKANVRNEDVDYPSEAHWKTFPERLEEHGVGWCVYQNDVSLPVGLEGEAKAWLGSFEDNPLEWFSQYHVRFAPTHRRHLASRARELEAAPKTAPNTAELARVRSELAAYTDDAFAKLPEREKSIHRRAFVTNSGDPHFHELEPLEYRDGATARTLLAPKGDVLHQLRRDVADDKLPAVSWIVAPENFSDHPGAPWYGAWYVSEVLDILTSKPDLWRKTIFILCYDENDGYFDHVPPFVPPTPGATDTGKVSEGIDVAVEHVFAAQERDRPGDGRTGPIGLGFRVPLVIASPWSRGGYVCSEVFDHTSILRFLENWVGHRTGRPLVESNISAWRRTVCGDLTSTFRDAGNAKTPLPPHVARKPFLGAIHGAQFRGLPHGFHAATPAEIAAARNPKSSRPSGWPRQEPGTRPSCALPYGLSVDGAIDADRKTFAVRFAADPTVAGRPAAGAPFHVYCPATSGMRAIHGHTRSYAVAAGTVVEDTWALEDFGADGYALRIHGPNGFHREFTGSANDPRIRVSVRSGAATATGPVLEIELRGAGNDKAVEVLVSDPSYHRGARTATVGAAGSPTEVVVLKIPLGETGGWHDFVVTVQGNASYRQRFAGRLETGHDSISDPAMGT